MRAATYKPKSKEEIARNMSAIRSKENRTEVVLRRALFESGLRFKKYASKLPGNPDIVFAKERVAVFVDGDFWHARMLREEGTETYKKKLKTSNRDYWLKKFKRRLEIDSAVNKKLGQLGWCVLRFWETDLKSDLPTAVSIIAYNIRSRRTASGTRASLS